MERNEVCFMNDFLRFVIYGFLVMTCFFSFNFILNIYNVTLLHRILCLSSIIILPNITSEFYRLFYRFYKENK